MELIHGYAFQSSRWAWKGGCFSRNYNVLPACFLRLWLYIFYFAAMVVLTDLPGCIEHQELHIFFLFRLWLHTLFYMNRTPIFALHGNRGLIMWQQHIAQCSPGIMYVAALFQAQPDKVHQMVSQQADT
ncbi:MAG: hypothetical protein CSB34_00935 [Desulfobulbus propionicus]|nr:MAG: hypothetical protein CSB34_00935 [Desulfobulbus propionicus]